MLKHPIVIIGGGAAGFFAAISAAKHAPDLPVIILEKTSKFLAKVKISGGGRCNVTHACFDNRDLIKNYPRGYQELKSAFVHFSVKHTLDWFESRGVEIKEEDDGRMFPITDDSQTIIDCLMREAKLLGVQLFPNTEVLQMRHDDGVWKMSLSNGQNISAGHVIVATGGSPKASGLAWLEALGHRIVAPLPSLFTFNLPKNPITALMGVAVPWCKAKIIGSGFAHEGPLLVTHWGMSGPAILKLSAFGARWLAEREYRFDVQVNWIYMLNEEQARETLLELRNAHVARMVANKNPFDLPSRLWEFLADKAGVPLNKPYGELSNKEINKLSAILTSDIYQAHGKTTYKEEFVTCGGVDLRDVDFPSMRSKACPNLSFAGEVMDIDGVTGGFNFQAAWTTGFLAGKHATHSY